MNPEQAAAFINAQVAIMNCRVAGMVAENMQRAATGQSMAYTDAAFAEVESEFYPALSQDAITSLFKQANDSNLPEQSK